MEHDNITERNKKWKSSEAEVASKWFVYTTNHQQTNKPAVADITHVQVDTSVREIPVNAFREFKFLTHLQLPETLRRIGKRAFGECRGLMCVEFISDSSINKNPNLEKGLIVFPERSPLLQIDEYAFSFCNSLRKVVICSVSTKLGKAAFAQCSCLRSVELPDGLQVIESRLFAGCGLLTTVKLPSSLITICKEAFDGCRRLHSFDLFYGLVEIGEGSFSVCESIQTLHIPATVTTIGGRAFRDCRGLRDIKLPPTLERIEGSTFSGCRMLEYIKIPPTVSFIGQQVFRGCRSLSHVRIPQSVEPMLNWGFENCINLISIELPEGLLITEGESYSVASFSCSSLVNLAIPTLRMEASLGGYLRNSKLGSVVDGDAALLSRKLKHRFDNSPLNKLCYYQSYHSSDGAMVKLRSLMEVDPLAAASQIDEFGMTPLHVLSLSQTPNLNMLLLLMKGGNADHIIHGKDFFGKSPMDYLCLNRMPCSPSVIRTLLESRFSYVLDLNRSFKSHLMQAVDEALAADWSSRRREVVGVYFELANYERKEILTLVELYLWKVQIDEVDFKEKNAVNRQRCRIMSGATIVIPYVLPFLDKFDLEDYFATSSSGQSVTSIASFSDEEDDFLWFLT
eukprot:scaffold1228_cov119-Cylindrotheca_fusiformis.AAC.3